MNNFYFIDSSGIINQDRFFGIGLLIVKAENVGKMVHELCRNYQKALAMVKSKKDKVLGDLISAGKQDEVIKILQTSRRFEMKFDNLKPSVASYYEVMIDQFFSEASNRFSVMIIDKLDPSFNVKYVGDVWDAYTNCTATLIVKEMAILKKKRMCAIVDEITKPSSKPLPLENTILKAVDIMLKKYNIDTNDVFGAISVESHSNILMQLADVLLGAVMYDYKKKNGLTSKNVQRKKEIVVNKIRKQLGVADMSHDFSFQKPVSFSVIEAKFAPNKKTP
jgi:hypothetical protein